MKGRNPWHTPVTIIITVIGVIAIVALVTVIVLQNREIPQKYKVLWSVVRVVWWGSHLLLKLVSAASPHQYGIVMDAGSSHTSVYIYRWPAEKENNTGRVEQMHACQVAGMGCTAAQLSAAALTPAPVCRSRHLQLRLCSPGGRGVSESLHERG